MKDSLSLEMNPQEPQTTVRRLLEDLKAGTPSDFVAVALYDPDNREIRWRLAYGASSDRYRAIAIRIGKGIAGEVLQSKRPMLVASFPADVPEDPLEYPIMLVEKLVSCYAVPIGEGRRMFGVLMIASRRSTSFGEKDKELTAVIGRAIGSLYAPSYASADIRSSTDVQNPEKPPLQQYLQEKHRFSEAWRADFEILDQRIMQLPEPLQEEMTEWFERLAALLLKPGSSRLQISVERKEEGQYIAVTASAPGRLEHPHEQLSWLIERVGDWKGNVEMYNEPGTFRLRINFTVGLLLEGKPWNFPIRDGNHK